MRVTVKGGVWRNAEDEVLKAAVMKYGLNQWARISSLLNRKSAKQCKARWYDWLDPSIKKTEWTREEDEKLLHLAKVMPTQWRTIAPMVGRTAQQCLERYERLLDQVMHKDGDYDPADDPRRLRPGEIDPNPEGRPARPDPVDMDEDEKEMLAEARARLANTRGKKAKRKAREAQLEEARRLATLQKKRELKAAGIELRGKAKRMKAINYNQEVAFDLGAPKGPHDTLAEREATAEMQKEFQPMTIEQLEGRKRRDLEQELIKQDIRRHKERQESDLPSVLAQQAAEHGTGLTHRRYETMLPAPALSENEYAQVMDQLKRGQDLASEVATPGAATAHMLGDYATPSHVVRTPMRTPAGTDRVRAEALAQATAMKLQTPLLGQTSETSMVNEEFDGVEPGAAVTATPNPLATISATPGQGGLVAGTSTPGRATPGGATPAATPMRDALGINTPGFETPMSTGGSRAEKRRAAAARREVASDLEGLPQPHNEYKLAGGAADESSEYADAEERMEEDAADAAARRARELEATRVRAARARSSVLQRALPRPAATAAPADEPSSSTKPLLQRAEALVSAELGELLSHDARRYPVSGKTAKKRKRKLDALLEAGSSTYERALHEDELAEAAGMLEAESELLQEKYGHGNVSRQEYLALMHAAHIEHAVDPQTGELTKLAAMSNAQRIRVYKARHAECLASMQKHFESSVPLDEKFKLVVRGLVERDVKLGKELRDKCQALAAKRQELACYEELERTEAFAVPRRKEELQVLVTRQRELEMRLQERYKMLLSQR